MSDLYMALRTGAATILDILRTVQQDFWLAQFVVVLHAWHLLQ